MGFDPSPPSPWDGPRRRFAAIAIQEPRGHPLARVADPARYIAAELEEAAPHTLPFGHSTPKASHPSCSPRPSLPPLGPGGDRVLADRGVPAHRLDARDQRLGSERVRQEPPPLRPVTLCLV